MGVNRQCGRNLAVSKNFDREFKSTDRPARVERFRCDRPVDLKFGQFLQVHNFPLRLENVGETALVRHSLLDRQLTAFEPSANSRTGARLLTLGTATRGLPMTTTSSAPNALLFSFRTLVGAQITQIEWHRFVSIHVATGLPGRRLLTTRRLRHREGDAPSRPFRARTE